MSNVPCPHCGQMLPLSHFNDSISNARCTNCGKVVFGRTEVEVADLRSSASRRAEQDARAGLNHEDEQLAHAVLILDSFLEWGNQPSRLAVPEKLSRDLAHICNFSSTTDQEVKIQVRKIGKFLCENGGDYRMQKIGYRAIHLGAHQHTLECCWSGICGWYNGYAHNLDF